MKVLQIYLRPAGLFFVCFLALLAIDYSYFGRTLFAEDWPIFNWQYGLRAVAFAAASAAFLFVLKAPLPRQVSLVESDDPRWFIGLQMVVPMLLACLFTSLFIIKPATFSYLSLEDKIIEWGSAFLLCGAALFMGLAFLVVFKNALVGWFTKLSMAVLSVIFFVIAMEEISWFQRVLDIETPEAFLNGNIQKEMNFHNFDTDRIENLYYLGALIFLVVMPFFRQAILSVTRSDFTRILFARSHMVVVALPIAFYNFDMWNISLIQYGLYVALGALLILALHTPRRDEKYALVVCFVVAIATQALFLANGERFARFWEVTEYKEFFIALAFCIYAFDVLYRQVKQRFVFAS